jgi:hypothetical protein
MTMTVRLESGPDQIWSAGNTQRPPQNNMTVDKNKRGHDSNQSIISALRVMGRVILTNNILLYPQRMPRLLWTASERCNDSFHIIKVQCQITSTVDTMSLNKQWLEHHNNHVQDVKCLELCNAIYLKFPDVSEKRNSSGSKRKPGSSNSIWLLSGGFLHDLLFKHENDGCMLLFLRAFYIHRPYYNPWPILHINYW